MSTGIICVTVPPLHTAHWYVLQVRLIGRITSRTIPSRHSGNMDLFPVLQCRQRPGKARGVHQSRLFILHVFLNPAPHDSSSSADLPGRACLLYIISAIPSALNLAFPPPSPLCPGEFTLLSQPLAEQIHPACCGICAVLGIIQSLTVLK